MVVGAGTSPFWWPHSGREGSATAGNGADGGDGNGPLGALPGGTPNAANSSPALGEGGGATASSAPAEKFDATVDMGCTVGATMLDGTTLHTSVSLKINGGHPDKSRFYTVADVISGTTDATRKHVGTYVSRGVGSAVDATVPAGFQFPRDDVLVEVIYFPSGVDVPGNNEGFSVSAEHNDGRVQTACGNAAVTYFASHGGIKLPTGG